MNVTLEWTADENSYHVGVGGAVVGTLSGANWSVALRTEDFDTAAAISAAAAAAIDGSSHMQLADCVETLRTLAGRDAVVDTEHNDGDSYYLTVNGDAVAQAEQQRWSFTPVLEEDQACAHLRRDVADALRGQTYAGRAEFLDCAATVIDSPACLVLDAPDQDGPAPGA